VGLETLVVEGVMRHAVSFLPSRRHRTRTYATREERVPVSVPVCGAGEAPVALRIAPPPIRNLGSAGKVSVRSGPPRAPGLFAPLGTVEAWNEVWRLRSKSDIHALPWNAGARPSAREEVAAAVSAALVVESAGWHAHMPEIGDGPPPGAAAYEEPHREAALARLHDRAAGILVIGGVPHERLPEPVWRVHEGMRDAWIHLAWSNDRDTQGQPHRCWRLDDLEGARAAMAAMGMDATVEGAAEVIDRGALRARPECAALLRGAAKLLLDVDARAALNLSRPALLAYADLRDALVAALRAVGAGVFGPDAGAGFAGPAARPLAAEFLREATMPQEIGLFVRPADVAPLLDPIDRFCSAEAGALGRDLDDRHWVTLLHEPAARVRAAVAFEAVFDRAEGAPPAPLAR